MRRLRECCVQLKSSLVRGHEDFAAALEVLARIRGTKVTLTQLANTWELANCVKKVRKRRAVEDTAPTEPGFFVLNLWILFAVSEVPPVGGGAQRGVQDLRVLPAGASGRLETGDRVGAAHIQGIHERW